MSEETVTITKKEYIELQDAYDFLAALQAAGVDNWQGYDVARQILNEWKEEEEK